MRLGKSFCTAMLALNAVATTSIASESIAQVAVNDFNRACVLQEDSAGQIREFERLGWHDPSTDLQLKDLDVLLSQYLVKPEKVNYLHKTHDSGARYFASVVVGRAMKAGPSIRDSVHCFVRMWSTEDLGLRDELRRVVGREPDSVVDSSEVSADAWTSWLKGEVIAFREVKAAQGSMITIGRFSKEPLF